MPTKNDNPVKIKKYSRFIFERSLLARSDLSSQHLLETLKKFKKVVSVFDLYIDDRDRTGIKDVLKNFKILNPSFKLNGVHLKGFSGRWTAKDLFFVSTGKALAYAHAIGIKVIKVGKTETNMPFSFDSVGSLDDLVGC